MGISGFSQRTVFQSHVLLSTKTRGDRHPASRKDCIMEKILMNYLSLDKPWYSVNNKAENIENPELKMELFTLSTYRLETLPIGKAQTESGNAEEPANTNYPTCSIWTGYGYASEPNTDTSSVISYQSIILDGLLKLCGVLFIVNRKVIFKKRAGKSPVGPQADMSHEH